MKGAAMTAMTGTSARGLTRRAILAALIMALGALIAWLLTPTLRLADEEPIKLESMIPTAFGDWAVNRNASAGVVNPQQTQLINRLYSQTLSRTYVNTQTGTRVMLSIAYGEDQRDSMQLHYPEVCYPAQGFQIRSNRKDLLTTQFGVLPIRRLETVLGAQRYEPVTYWTMIGSKTALGGVEKKIAEMRYGMKGIIVDGLLFRVSSIDRDSADAFVVQGGFIDQLFKAVPADVRLRLSGLGLPA